VVASELLDELLLLPPQAANTRAHAAIANITRNGHFDLPAMLRACCFIDSPPRVASRT